MAFWRKRKPGRETGRSGYVKVRFHLEQDEDGYPPNAWERLWAQPEGPCRFRLDNIPWYARDVAAGDVVEAHEAEDGMLEFDRVVERSGHSTVRVVLYDPQQTQLLRDELAQLGCETELSHIPSFISVDVPAQVEMAPVLELLLRGHEEERWDVETGYVGDPHVDAFG